MAAVNTPTTLASRLKEVYSDGITQLIPSSNELVGKRLKFKKELELGKQAVFDVQLSHEQGFTVGQGELTLNAAVAQVSAKATVDAYQIILRSRVSYDLINRAKTTKAAFARFNDSKFIPMVESFRKREEIYGICGRDSLGKVLTNTSGALVISADTWAPSLWLGMEGAVLVAGTTRAATATQHDGDLTVSAVDISTRTVTVTGTSTSVVAGDFLYFKGDIDFTNDVFNCPVGLMAIARNAGTLYGISAATYSLWAANAYDAGTSSLTLAKILAAAAKSADKGCDEKLTCLVPVSAFQNLVSDQAALRKYDASYSKSKLENGSESLAFYGATGLIEVVPYMYMKQGEALLFPERYTYLIGSTEMTNIVGPGGDIVFDLESTSAKEMRLVSEWTTFCERPGWVTLITRSDAAAL